MKVSKHYAEFLFGGGGGGILPVIESHQLFYKCIYV